MKLADFLPLLKQVKKTGRGWTARCPAHDDRNPSLSIAEGRDGRILLKCHAGCELSAILAELGLEVGDLFSDGTGKRGGRGTKGKRGRGGAQIPPKKAATPHKASGLSLEQYAAEKKIPVDFLRGLGLTTIHLGSQPVVRIPYRGADGLEKAVCFRLAMVGEDRFRWRSGSKPCLYGLWRLKAAKERGHVCLVEGPSDCHTLWYHDIPAVGLPGAAAWREEWAELLDDIPCIYVPVEPDKGGEAVLKWLSRSKIRDHTELVRLQGAKDASALYLANPSGFVPAWQEALASSVPYSALERAEAESRSRELFQRCAELAWCPNILGRLPKVMQHLGLTGEQKVVKLLYLALTTRLLRRPTSVVVKGPSSGGKSYIVDKMFQLFPSSCYYVLSAMSERALAYSEEPLKHRMLVIFEAAGLSSDLASYLTRSLLSEGRLRYETVEKTAQGLRPRLIEREGPTGLIVTTTQLHLHPENETRLLSVTVNDSREQTKAILKALADENEHGDNRSLLAPFHDLQDWLALKGNRVTIPYAKTLAELIPPVAVRLRRDFGSLLNLIRAHALLHRASRDTDASGRVVASITDYAAVRDLASPLFSEELELTVPSAVRETVEAVAVLCEEAEGEVSIKQLATHLKLDRTTVTRRVKAAVDQGYLRNLEDRPRKAFRLVPGSPMPEDVELLPAPEKLGCWSAPCDSEGLPPPPTTVPFGGTTESQMPFADDEVAL